MDEMVLATQKWLNNTYGNDSRFNRVDEDGATGWETIYGLTRAFQIELGITDTADAFGPTTKRLMNRDYPNGITQQSDDDTSTNRVYAIIQGALWCKGYSTGSPEITCHFYGGTGEGVRTLKTHMGISDVSSTVTVDIMEALLSMRQYVLVSGGTYTIRSIQQSLNASYRAYIGIIPCDGLYGREMNDALIKVLQAIEGFTPDEATGYFGNGTRSRCPVLPDSSEPAATRLLKYALCCNGYTLSDLSATWTSETTSQVKAFQSEYCLEADGIAGLNTWMALLLSSGNPDRSASACDCATILNANKANALYAAGYRYVGRYLTGGIGSGSTAVSKAMTTAELEAIFAAGLRVFAIYQDNDPVVSYYSEIQGTVDGANAVTAARNLGIPADSIIYFAVDCDMMDYQVTSNAIPYFRGIRKALRAAKNLYKVGIYGSRNICTRVCKQGLAKSSFVADMSTGYSGNMGYPIPDNWAFDQFSEYVFTGAAVNFDLDKDAYSGRYSGFGSLANYPENYRPIPSQELLTDRAEFLLAKAGINMGIGYKLETTVTVDGLVPGIEITYKAGRTGDVISGTVGKVTVKNNQVIDTQLAEITGTYNGLSESVKGLISDDGTFSLLAGFTEELGNGSISFTYALSGNELTAHFQIEEQLWDGNSGTEKLYVDITIKITNNGTYNSEFATLKSAINAETASAMQKKCFFVLGAVLTAASIAGGVVLGGAAVINGIVKVLEGIALAVAV